ncbi:hypothetical protein BDFB_011232 [Asbolus verrucosus]|uniref:Uncharacterized protein n=1 Tax=Asbolus verrucosus TaxID=1661398 RepID=A0A482VP72_ASBVE|nr:hypothetical protein BDFB_011232 [Asbolus verrucosus]
MDNINAPLVLGEKLILYILKQICLNLNSSPLCHNKLALFCYNNILLSSTLLETNHPKDMHPMNWPGSMVIENVERGVSTCHTNYVGNTIQHTNNIISGWWERQRLLDKEDIAPLIINLADDN